MRRLILVSLLLAGCGGLSRSESARLAADLRVYVDMVPRRSDMDSAQLASHTLLGEACVTAATKGGE